MVVRRAGDPDDGLVSAREPRVGSAAAAAGEDARGGRAAPVDDRGGTSLVKVPFAALVHTTATWDDSLVEAVADAMRREGVHRSVVVSYREGDGEDAGGGPRATLEARIARIDGEGASVALAPVGILGYQTGGPGGSPALSVRERDRARLQAFLAFNV